MASILVILFFIIVAVLAIAIVATLLVIFAVSLGKLFVSFSWFASVETATPIALLAIIAATLFIWQVLGTFGRTRLPTSVDDQDDEVEEEEDTDADEVEEEWETDDEEDDDPSYEVIEDFTPSIPRWRQPIKPVSFEGVGRNDLCPCGSGRKYKNCHGRATAHSSG